MKSCSARPLLLIDGDGVVSSQPLPARSSNGSPATFECFSYSGWEERAEEHLPRLLGLPGGWRIAPSRPNLARRRARGSSRDRVTCRTRPPGLREERVTRLEDWARRL